MKAVVVLSVVLLLVYVVNVAFCASPGRKDVWRIKQLDKEIIEASPMEESRSVDPKFARMTWHMFNRQVGRNDNRDRQKIRNSLRSLQTKRNGLRSGGITMGPMGPRGPAGPQGPKGGNFTKEDIVEIARSVFHMEIRKQFDSFRKADHRRSLINDSDVAEMLEPELPKVSNVFVWKLKKYTNVPKNSRVELGDYRTIRVPQSAEDTAAATWGRFYAPRSGYYRFDARVHLQMPKKPNSFRDLFSVCICYNGVCGDKKMIEGMSGFGPGDRQTVHVSGPMYLKANEYVSVFVDNASKNILDVFEGSEFAGYFLGSSV